jgi:hypothetical protein
MHIVTMSRFSVFIICMLLSLSQGAHAENLCGVALVMLAHPIIGGKIALLKVKAIDEITINAWAIKGREKAIDGSKVFLEIYNYDRIDKKTTPLAEVEGVWRANYTSDHITIETDNLMRIAYSPMQRFFSSSTLVNGKSLFDFNIPLLLDAGRNRQMINIKLAH